MNDVYMCDFETTVTENTSEQTKTEVWAAGIAQVQTDDNPVDENVYIENSIDNFFARLNCLAQRRHITAYFHNLKFDGSFIIDWLLRKGYKPALYKDDTWIEDKKLFPGYFNCTISDMGQWYKLTVCMKSRQLITFKDSLKLLPFSVSAIGKAFQTKHRKLTMDYVGDRKPGGIITDDEKKYISNDILVVKEALEIMFKDGLNRLTIGSCCKQQYKMTQMDVDLENFFPSMADECPIPGFDSIDSYIRKSYKGGWCYLRPEKANKVFKKGCTVDVNSLYPSMMLDNDYPVGKPCFWQGNEIPDDATKPNRLYFVRIKTRFKIKDGFLPTIQIKGSPFYPSTEWLTSSDFVVGGKRYSQYKKSDGKIIEARPILTLTKPDFELMKKHYDLYDFEILDGCWFFTMPGSVLFGTYINHWAKIKQTHTGAKRTQAKLFLNNLYGKFSSKADNTTKCPYLGEDGVVRFRALPNKDNKKLWYIPIGAYVTSWARNFTITAAQENYDNFIYSDTDSIHCSGSSSELKGIKVHPTDFSCWALEATWDEAIFVRQKTYIEHVVEEDQKPCTPYYNVKCAGMDKRPKALITAKLNGDEIETTPDEEDFMNEEFTISDFKLGLCVPSKLRPKRIEGGVLLVNTTYKLR